MPGAKILARKCKDVFQMPDCRMCSVQGCRVWPLEGVSQRTKLLDLMNASTTVSDLPKDVKRKNLEPVVSVSNDWLDYTVVINRAERFNQRHENSLGDYKSDAAVEPPCAVEDSVKHAVHIHINGPEPADGLLEVDAAHDHPTSPPGALHTCGCPAPFGTLQDVAAAAAAMGARVVRYAGRVLIVSKPALVLISQRFCTLAS